MVDAANPPIGDESEAGSFVHPANPQIRPPMPPQSRPPQNMPDPNTSYDPYNDDSIFMGSNAIKNKYKGSNQKNMFEDSMIGAGGKNMFDETMRDVSMSMDQDISKNDISRLFGNNLRQSTNELFASSKPNDPKKQRGLFDKIEEDEEEDKYEDNIRPNRQSDKGLFDDSPTKSPALAQPKGFLDDTMNEDDDYEKFNVRPPPQQPQQNKNMFEETFDEGDSNASMLFPTKKPPTQNPANALPGLVKKESKPTAFDYGNPDPPQPPANKSNKLFMEDEYEEDESQLFPVKKNSQPPPMFEEDPNESMMSTDSRDKSFIQRQKQTNNQNHMMAQIMLAGLGKKKSEPNANEISIGDEIGDDYEPEPEVKISPPEPPQSTSKPKGPIEYHPPTNKNRMFLDDSQMESDLTDAMNLPTKTDSITTGQTQSRKLFMDDEDESFVFEKPKPKANPIAAPANNPPQQKKGFMFDDADESFDGFNLPDKKPGLPPMPAAKENKVNPLLKMESDDSIDFSKGNSQGSKPESEKKIELPKQEPPKQDPPLKELPKPESEMKQEQKSNSISYL
jgi:hypothetical protein